MAIWMWLMGLVCAVAGTPLTAVDVAQDDRADGRHLEIRPAFSVDSDIALDVVLVLRLPPGVVATEATRRLGGEWIPLRRLETAYDDVIAWKVGTVRPDARPSFRIATLQAEYDGEADPWTSTVKPRMVERSDLMQAVEDAHAGLDPTLVIDVVAGDDPVDSTGTGIVSTLTDDMINKLPSNRTQHDLINLVPGGQGGANPRMSGGAPNENTYMLDGVDISDPVTATFSNNFNFNAIQQIDVLMGGTMPEFPTSLGGGINLRTRSGNNNLEFLATAYGSGGLLRTRMDERLTADGLVLAPTDFDTVSRSLQAAMQVSGPLVRDKAWLLMSYEHNRARANSVGVPQARDYDSHYVLGKITVQPTAQHRVSLQAQTDPTTIDNTNQASPYQKSESQPRQVQGGLLSQLNWQWFPSDSVSLNAIATVQKSYIEQSGVPCTHDPDSDDHPCEPGETQGNVDWETPGRLGIGGAYNSVNYGQYLFDDRWRTSLNVKLGQVAWTDPFEGTHDWKIGFALDHTSWDLIQGLSGNLQYVDINEVPFDPNTLKNYFWTEATGPIAFRTTGSTASAFVQDSWQPVPNLTLNYGTRLDSFVMRNDVGEPILNGTLLGPRLFVAWDPKGRGNTRLSTGYGRYNDTGRLGVASYLSEASFGSHLFLGEFFAGSGFPTGFLNNSANDYDTDPGTLQRTSNDTLAAPRVDEVLVQAHQALTDNFAVRSDLTARWTRRQYVADEQNLLFDSDGSAIIGSRTGDFTQPFRRLRTPNAARRDYLRWDLTGHKVRARGWEAQTTWSVTASKGTTVQALDGSFANDPQTRFNYGPLNTDLRHVVKSWAWWDVPLEPWAPTLGATLEYYGGAPEDRLYVAENSDGSGLPTNSLRIRPRGTYLRLEPVWDAGVRYQQQIPVRKGELAIDASVTNLFDNRAPSSYDLGFLDSNNRLLIRSRQPAREATLGLTYNF